MRGFKFHQLVLVSQDFRFWNKKLFVLLILGEKTFPCCLLHVSCVHAQCLTKKEATISLEHTLCVGDACVLRIYKFSQKEIPPFGAVFSKHYGKIDEYKVKVPNTQDKHYIS